MRMAWVAMAMWSVACGGSQSAASTAEEAQRRYDERDYGAAASLYEDACEGGAASACSRLGLMHALGEGVSQNPKTAADLYRKGCDGGDASGCGMLGKAYADGKGVEQSEKRSAELFQRGCQGGDPPACGEWGRALWQGRGVASDQERGKGVLERSCGAGHARGCFYLGVLLRTAGDAEGAKSALGKACQLREREACGALKVRMQQ